MHPNTHSTSYKETHMSYIPLEAPAGPINPVSLVCVSAYVHVCVLLLTFQFYKAGLITGVLEKGKDFF